MRARVRRAERSRSWTMLLLLLSIGVALVLTVSAWWRLRGHVRTARELHDAVAEREQRLRALLDNTSDSIWWVDREQKLRGFNRTFAGDHLAGHGVAAELGQPIDAHEDAARQQGSRATIDRALAGETFVVEQHTETAGRPVSHLITFTPIQIDRAIVGVTAYSKNISERAAMERALREQTTELQRVRDELRDQATRDPLTGLCNRRGFLELAENYMRLADRNRRPLRVFFIDLDGMKQINDDLGHDLGDEALLATAALLRASFRSSDILARLGGDEFAALAVDAFEERAILERLRFCTEQFNNHELRRFRLQMSVGCTVYDPATPTTIDELLVQADAQMYEQKRSRKAHLAIAASSG